MSESVGDLDRELQDLFEGQPARLQSIFEGQAIDVLLDEVGWLGSFVERDHLHHMRMIELQHALRFLGELTAHGLAAVGIAGPTRLEHFDGDDLSGRLMLCLIDRAEGA